MIFASEIKLGRRYRQRIVFDRPNHLYRVEVNGRAVGEAATYEKAYAIARRWRHLRFERLDDR